MAKADLFKEAITKGLIPADSVEKDYTIAKLEAVLNDTTEKTLSNSANDTVQDNVPDVVLMGVKINNWRVLCKAFSIKEGWMKSTKAMNLSTNQVLVQVTTQQKNQDGSYVIAEALIVVTGNLVESIEKGIYEITN